MQKIKNAVYEHRFGFMFFFFLLAYGFFVSGSMEFWNMDEQMYTFHVLDFSVGFCTKLLPGAICNFIFGDPMRTEIAVYLMFLTTFYYLLVGLLVGKAFKESKSEHRFWMFSFIVLLLTGPVTFAYDTGLDIYWVLAAIVSICCLQNRLTYIMVVPAMIFAIMAHFAGIICYVPFVAIFILYKISVSENETDKKMLWMVWWILVTSTISLSLYMAVYEAENVKISMEELNNMLASKGIQNFRYYDFAFFRAEAEEKLPDIFMGAATDSIENVDMTQSAFKILINMIKQQTMVTAVFANFRGDLKYFLIVLPIVFVIYKSLWIVFKGSAENKLKKFSVFCMASLFFVSLFFGLMFSTDTIRWLSHAFKVFLALFVFVFSKEKDEIKTVLETKLNKIPTVVIIGYLGIYAVSAIF